MTNLSCPRAALLALAITELSGTVTARADAARPSAAPPPPPAMAIPTGDVHDFDVFAGAWTFKNRRLKARGVGSTEWDEFPATSCATIHLGSVSNIDEVVFPTRGWAGVTVRTFDVAKHQWSIYWVSSRDGLLSPPVVGGFKGSVGDFYGDDTDDGRPVKARFHWIKHDKDHLIWSQSFSYDGGRTWEMNWTADLTRTDEATACDHGHPRP
jgi:hypothetical protein